MRHSAPSRDMLVDNERDECAVQSLVHRGKPVDTDEQYEKIHCHCKEALLFGPSGPRSGCGRIVLVRYDENRSGPETCPKKVVLKMIEYGDDRLRHDVARDEARILRRLCAREAVDLHHDRQRRSREAAVGLDFFCLPLEMWRDISNKCLYMIFPRRPMDVYEHMKQRNFRGLPINAVARILQQTVRAVATLHSQFSIIHNDVKPENILIDPSDNNRCWLCDFGGATEMNSAGVEESWVMTFLYAAPERVSKKHRYDERADSWSLGVLAAELISGQSICDGFISDERWNALMKQAEVLRTDSDMPIEEVLDEPLLMEKLIPISQCQRSQRLSTLRSNASAARCAALRDYLWATVRIRACDRQTANELLDPQHACAPLLQN